MDLATSFDDDPEAYDRSRPVAPPAVFDELCRLATLEPGCSVVEIGAGTGQATRPLVERGLRVVALEPGRNMAAFLGRELAGHETVDVRATTFERWDPGDAPADAVIACNSFHWIDPAVRFAKAATVLTPSGHLAVLSMSVVVPDGGDRFWWDVQDDWEAVGAERLDPATKHPDLVEDLAEEFHASGWFEEPVVRRYPFTVEHTAESYATNLSTQSTVKELGPAPAAELVDRVRRRIERQGDRLTVHLLAVLTLARRRQAPQHSS